MKSSSSLLDMAINWHIGRPSFLWHTRQSGSSWGSSDSGFVLELVVIAVVGSDSGSGVGGDAGGRVALELDVAGAL